MMYYPIQETGATAQFPMVRTRRWQTLETQTVGGHVARGLQPEARRVHWQLDYVDLSDAEAQVLRDLFEQSKGGLRSFVFVDPMANLFGGTEQLGRAPWQSSGGVGVVKSVDESPAVFQLTNSGQAVGMLEQSLALPAGREFCLSCWAAGTAGEVLGLRLGGSTRQTVANGAWQRLWLTAQGEAAGATICAIELAPGGEASVHSLQLEAQPTPSAYRAGVAGGGVYPGTRFAQESLDVVATGPNRNGVRVELVSRLTE